jgi:hypothetical protein
MSQASYVHTAAPVTGTAIRLNKLELIAPYFIATPDRASVAKTTRPTRWRSQMPHQRATAGVALGLQTGTRLAPAQDTSAQEKTTYSLSAVSR